METSLSRATAYIVQRGQRLGPMSRIVICIVAVLAVMALLFPMHLVDRPLAAALNFFLIVVLFASIVWGLRYAILLSFLAAFGFSWLVPPFGKFHIADSRVWAVLAACLVTGITASHLSDRVRRALDEANERRAEAVAEQQRFTDLVNSVEGIVWEADAATLQFHFVSRQAERVLGYPTERWLREQTFWKDHLHPEDRDRAVQFLVDAGMHKRNQDFEYRMIAADGRVVWTRDIVTVVAEDGQPIRLRGVMIDITRRMQAEGDARRSQRELRDVVNTVPAHVWSALPDGSVDFVNQRWQEFTGLRPEAVLGGNWETIIHPDDRIPFISAWRAALKSGQVMESEIRLQRADGEYRWWFIRNVPLRDEAGNISKWYGTGIDIEDRKRADEALLSAMAERTRLAAFREAIGTALAGEEDLRKVLHECAQAMVRHLGAAFARVWTLSCDGQELELQASAGMYTRLDGTHSRIPVGHLKVGLIAREKKPHLTNDVQNDPRVNDKNWARRESMVAFAGYPLLVGDRVVGVIAMFSQKALNESTFETLSVVADTIAQGIDRKRAEHALRQSERNLAEAQGLTHTGSFVWDTTTKEAVYLSEEWYRIYGLDPGKAAWPERVKRLHPDDRRLYQAAINRAIDEKSDYELEYRLLLPDGTTKYVHAIGHPILDKSRQVIQFVGSVTDISERKRAEEALRSSEAYLQEAQRLSQTGSWAWSPATGEIRYWSDESYRVMGFDPAGRPPPFEIFFKRIHPDDQASIREQFDRATRERRDFEIECRIVHPGGEIRNIQSVGHPILSASGDLIEFVGTVVDVTERKRSEAEREKLREREAELAHINRVTTMGELTASLAHEVNQPITAAMTNANTCLRWLNRDIPDIEEAREAAGRIVKDTKRAGEIISRIRLLFKKGTAQRELVNINAVIDEIITLLRNEASRHGITVNSRLGQDLPQILADRIQLQQVLMNLMINSIDAMKPVDGTRQLTISSQRDGNGQLLISVADTGTGLPSEMGRIFDPFYTTKPHGTGMGLAISRTIIESHGGRLWAASNSDRGAVFSFTMPGNIEAQT